MDMDHHEHTLQCFGWLVAAGSLVTLNVFNSVTQALQIHISNRTQRTHSRPQHTMHSLVNNLGVSSCCLLVERSHIFLD